LDGEEVEGVGDRGSDDVLLLISFCSIFIKGDSKSLNYSKRQQTMKEETFNTKNGD
jgi:hypothetical protein